MAKGACGDCSVRNPIAHLNGLTAIWNKRPGAIGANQKVTGPNQPA